MKNRSSENVSLGMDHLEHVSDGAIHRPPREFSGEDEFDEKWPRNCIE